MRRLLLLFLPILLSSISLYSQENVGDCCPEFGQWLIYYPDGSESYSFHFNAPVGDAGNTQESCYGHKTYYDSIDWDFGDGTTQTAYTSHVSHTYNLNGADCMEYDVSMTLFFHTNLSDYTCTRYFTILVSDGTNSDYSINITPGSCGQISLAYTANNGIDITDPLWSMGDGDSYSGASVQHQYSNPGTYTISLYSGSPENSICPLIETYTFEGGSQVSFDCETSACSNEVTCHIHNYNPLVTYQWNFEGALFSDVSNPDVTYVFPEGGDHIVELISTDSCTASMNMTYTIGNYPAYFESPADYCEGDALDISHLTTAGSSYLWEISKDGVLLENLSGASPVYTFVQTGTYTITLNYTSNTGCSDTYSQDVTVYPQVNAPGTLDVTPGCNKSLGLAIVLDAGEQAEINWGDGSLPETATTSDNYTHQYEQAGNYTINVLYSNQHCSREISKTIHFSHDPQLNIVSGEDGICEGESLVLYMEIVNQGDYTVSSIRWYRGSSLQGSSESLNISEGGNYHLEVELINSASCTKVVESNRIIQEYPMPEPGNISITGASCPGQPDGTVQLTGFSQQVSNFGYHVNGSTEQYGSSYTLDNMGSGVFLLEISNAGCTYNETLEIPDNSPEITTSSSPSLCDGTPGQASVELSSGVSYLFNWYNLNSPSVSLAITNTLTAAPGTYGVEITDQVNGCVYQEIIQISESHLEASLSENEYATCPGVYIPVTVNASLNGESTGLLYSWYMMTSSEGIWEAVSGSGSTNNLSPGKYYVSVSSGNCEKQISFDIDTLNPIELTFAIDTANCPGDEGTITVLPGGGDGYYTYEWYDGSTNPQITGTADGLLYDVTVSDMSGCTATGSDSIPSLTGNLPQLVSVTNHGCWLEVNVSGDSPEFNMQWYAGEDQYLYESNEDTLSIPEITDTINVYAEVHSHTGGNNMQTGTDFIKTSGTYQYLLTDANGCSTYGQQALSPVDDTLNLSFDFVWSRVEQDTVVEEELPDPSYLEDLYYAQSLIQEQVDACLTSQEEDALSTYLQNYRNINNFSDEFGAIYEEQEQQYTLYFYDRAGYLAKTVPPEGVDLLSTEEIDSVKQYRENKALPGAFPCMPDHLLQTEYTYNSLGQLTEQYSIDQDTSRFIYDSEQRLRFSQNGNQREANTFSYSKYDKLGRVIESGEACDPALGFDNSYHNLADDEIYPGETVSKTYLSYTVYDTPTEVTYYGQPQEYLTNRISYVVSDNDGDLSTEEDRISNYYSYDVHGNLKWMVSDLPDIGKQYLAYEYELVSGNVLQVHYNEYGNDPFHHRYHYDGSNRITKVETSHDGEVWDTDATYEYYQHGPLERKTLGHYNVQGVDYVYTIQGWLKTMNNPLSDMNCNVEGSDISADPGSDGKVSSGTARDAFGMNLGYYKGDFTRSGTVQEYLSGLYDESTTGNKNLYNGNISHWTHSRYSSDNTTDPYIASQTGIYRYDLLQRIKQARYYQEGAGTWQNTSEAYTSRYDYDRNGNLHKLMRFDQAGNQMDSLVYGYDGQSSGGTYDNSLQKHSNRLRKVSDQVPGSSSLHNDLYGELEYEYDSIGNLIRSYSREKHDYTGTVEDHHMRHDIEWNPSGKVKKVTISYETAPDTWQAVREMEYLYDAMGNRVIKKVKDDQDLNTVFDTEENTCYYYSRDAQGNLMSLYRREDVQSSLEPGTVICRLYLEEQPLYGSSREGVSQSGRLLDTTMIAGGEVPAFGSSEESLHYRSSYSNMLTGSLVLPDSELAGLISSKIHWISYSEENNTYGSDSLAAEMAAIVDESFAVAENLNGELQFYLVLADNYMGHPNRMLIFDRYGKLMKGSLATLPVNTECKPVIIKLPLVNRWAIVHENQFNQLAYHVVDMDSLGYPGAMNCGEVVLTNQPMGSPYNGYPGQHFAGFEDHQNYRSLLYYTWHEPLPGSSEEYRTHIMCNEFSPVAGLQPLAHELESLDGCGYEGGGELQLSPDAGQLAYYHHKKYISGFKHRQSYMHVMDLATDRVSLQSESHTYACDTLYGNYGDGMFSYNTNGEEIIFAEQPVVKRFGTDTVNTYLRRLNPLSPDEIAYMIQDGIIYGELFRGLDGRIYLSQEQAKGMEDNAWLYRFAENLGSNTYSRDSLPLYGGSNSSLLEGGFPSQVVKCYGSGSGEQISYSRKLGSKLYELSDHLGNVRVVISDRRFLSDENINYELDCNDIIVPEVVSSNDYYPFGMLRRAYNTQAYLFGFNGMESDIDRFSGYGTLYYSHYRNYDPRIARWYIMDSKSDLMPFESPYSFANNMPVFGSDTEGDICLPCVAILIGLLTAPSVAVAPTGHPEDAIAIQKAYELQEKWLLYSVLAGGVSSGALGRKFFTKLGKQYITLIAGNTLAEGYRAWKYDTKVDFVEDVLKDSFENLDIFDAFLGTLNMSNLAEVVLSATVDISPYEAEVIGLNKSAGEITVDAIFGAISEMSQVKIEKGKYHEIVKKVLLQTDAAMQYEVNEYVKEFLGDDYDEFMEALNEEKDRSFNREETVRQDKTINVIPFRKIVINGKEYEK